MNEFQHMPITEALYSRGAQIRRERDAKKKRRPPRVHKTFVFQAIPEETMRKLARRYPKVRRYLP